MTPETLRKWVRRAEGRRRRQAGPDDDERKRLQELERENRELRRANDILKAGCGFFCAVTRPATAEMTRYIDASRARVGVEPICEVLQVAPSTYYAARGRPPSARCLRDEALKPKLKQVHEAQFGVYGARKLWHQLRREAPRLPVAPWNA